MVADVAWMMPMTVVENLPFEVLPERNLYIVRARGEVSFQDIYDHLQSIMCHEDFYPGIDALYDFSNVECFSGDPEVLLATAEQMNDRRVIQHAAKTALVVSPNSEINFKIFRGYCIMTYHSLVENEVFNDMSQALTFLNQSDLELGANYTLSTHS